MWCKLSLAIKKDLCLAFFLATKKSSVSCLFWQQTNRCASFLSGTVASQSAAWLVGRAWRLHWSSWTTLTGKYFDSLKMSTKKFSQNLMYFISSNTHNQGAGWVPSLPWGGGGLSGEVGGWRGEKKFWRSYIVSNILYPISNILYSVFWSKLTSLLSRWWRRSWGRGRSRWEPEMGNSAAWPAGARNRFNLFCYVLENMKNGHVHRMFQKCFLSGRSCWGVWYRFDQQGSSDLQYHPKDPTYLQKLPSMFCENHQQLQFFVPGSRTG